jgi:hypothetical protein
MAGLDPAIHDLLLQKEERRGCPAIRAFTPVFAGLWPGMTKNHFFLFRTSTPAQPSKIFTISVKSEPAPFTWFAITHI